MATIIEVDPSKKGSSEETTTARSSSATKPSSTATSTTGALPPHPRRPATASARTAPSDPTPETSFSVTSKQLSASGFAQDLVSSVYPSPLPLLPLAPPHVAALRGKLNRRRSSYPPATTPGSSAGFPWQFGGTPDIKHTNSSELFIDRDGLGPFGNDISVIPGRPESSSAGSGMAGMGWDGLLDFGNMTPQRTPTKLAAVIERGAQSPRPSLGQMMSRTKSEPGDQKGNGVRTALGLLSPGRIAQAGTDMAWKTILGSVIEIEGVGEVGVSKVLQEIWKRGGGELVSAQSLWSSIVMALSLPSSSEASIRISTPSAHASTALQELYTLTLKHWEPAIFSGLLATYSASLTPTAAAPDIEFPSVSAPKYGACTPTKEFDASFAQWTNLTPGLGGDFNALFGGGTGLTPRGSISHPSNLGQFEFHFDERPPLAEQASGIDEILASMEEGQQEAEREMGRAATEATRNAQTIRQQQPHQQSTPQDQVVPQRFTQVPGNPATQMAYQLPTPETDSDGLGNTPRSNGSERGTHFSPDSMASPYVTGSSGAVSAISAISKDLVMTTSAPGSNRAAHPTSLIMPTEAFVPPPPMCMFFNPSFRDLQKGKVGVWKGDLNLRGKGGGTFSVLIVGEEVSGHLWQSHQWAPTLSHPVEAGPDDHNSPFTSKMLPVAFLAREGFTPVTMGMVLCNDDKIQAFVSMVQSMHSEGVSFHLPNPAGLPLVFLPAKFDPQDQLQRLGIAYMTKPGAPIPGGLPKIARGRPSDVAPPVEPKRKKRRQSMPAKASASPAQSKRREGVVQAQSGKAGASVSSGAGETVIEEKEEVAG